MREEGWFADRDFDDPDFWVLCIQVAGCIHTLSVYFSSEEEALDFLRKELIGKGEI